MADDPYIWLEEIESDEALAWVETRNQRTLGQFTHTDSFETTRSRLLSALNADDRIPGFIVYNAYLYNFWQDEQNPKGLWRRTTLEEYRNADSQWDVLLDIDALAEAENENWVYAGHTMLRPECNRALISLSRGGSDATEIREFNLDTRAFEPNGFFVPEAKNRAIWAGSDQVLVGTDFGEGTLTDSGYPRLVRLCTRGQSLEHAPTIFEGERSDVSVNGFTDPWNHYSEYYIVRALDFFNTQLFVYRNGELLRIEKPEDADFDINNSRLTLRLKSKLHRNGRTYSAGSLLITDLNDYLLGGDNLNVLYEPTPSSSLQGWDLTTHNVVFSVLDNVRAKCFLAKPTTEAWSIEEISSASAIVSESARSFESGNSDRLLMDSQGFLVPPKITLISSEGESELLRQSVAYFDTQELEANQHWTESKDGTRIPYFEVSNVEVSDDCPTLLYGYGGFEISMIPQYSPTLGLGWLNRGGRYVVANIRGGGEFGPAWHHAALKENRNKAYEDFIAVVEDLYRRGVTEKHRLGIHGGSNGGLLMGNMYVMRPELFGAVVAQVPLLDMSRYHRLLAGASWVAEYGDPDIAEQWAYLRGYSPYHTVIEEQEYPPILLTTSTRDDRVHPGHARKMTAKLEEYGHTVNYYENTAGGHAGAADNSQRAFMLALIYEFLWDVLTR